MHGLNTFLISTGAVTVLSVAIVWHQNKKKRAALLAEEQRVREKILLSPDTSWKKVGSVKEIFYYPLKSGKGKPVKQCNFENYGIIVNEQDVFSMKDRMFIVYDEKTSKFQTARQHPKLLLVNVSAVDATRARLEISGGHAPELMFDLPNITGKTTKSIECTMWWGEPVKCIDCGPETSKWLSKYLTESDSGMKLGICVPGSNRNVMKGAWENFSKLYTTMRNEDTGLFSDLASYMVLSEASVDDLNQRLIKPIPTLQLRPNIVVEGCEPYAEDEWVWIKIGDKAIIRNFKLCTRCSMVRIDPDTGIPDPTSEPLKTLRTYRKLKNAELDALESHAPHIGIYCGLYSTGAVRVGDDICIYQSN